ncbi:hypothetical protein A5821_001169 [Enterococcus sp. 7F3_DIV0205]|uniref:Uncharacterized protein n=1 Tax=Candidatus Enterococcus palustris TaxID=1834189 RepID=A0AAQ3W792_9ENTE|nr:hypothetical protein [Enterococcus sp. 7F3_DIV0205]OTN85566.1 hypothetical protein A5821_001512 [Enterococcus sp. 7F3_DIV0205]
MNFIHATNEFCCNRIVKSQCINPSETDIYSFLNVFFDRLQNVILMDAWDSFLEKQDFNFFPGCSYKYLGSGVYCFEEIDKCVAKRYDEEKPVLLKIEVKNTISKLDLNKTEEMETLKKKFEIHMVNYISNLEEESEQLIYGYFAEIISYNITKLLKGDKDGVPFSLGLSLDLLNYEKIYDIIFFKFPKREANYVTIKEISVITNLSKC